MPTFPKITAIDLFCGVGGLTHGMKLEGIEVKAGIDIDPACEYPYEKNNGSEFIKKSVKDVGSEELSAYFEDGEVTLLAGCAPCQPFSSFSNPIHKKKSEPDKPDSEDAKKDERWDLLNSFGRLVQQLKPDLVTMENVPKLAKQDVFLDFVSTLEDEGYIVNYYERVDCRKYGIPQSRTRLILLASRFGKVELIPETHTKENFVPIKEKISYLPPIDAGECCKSDPLHRAKGLSDINRKRIKASKPGGSWRDWPESLRPECYTKETGKTYPSVYGRMEWDLPSPTITTQFHTYGTGRFGHPEQNRAISLREAAILQTFPPDYDFVESGKPISSNRIGTLIGNAVPVMLGQVVAQSLKKHVEKYYEKQCSRH